MSQPSPSAGVNSGGDDLLSRWRDGDHWRRLCPQLTISDDDPLRRHPNISWYEDAPRGTNERLRVRLVDDGYALLDHPVCSNDLREKLARGISDLEVQHHLPATFILLFDEAWMLAAESHRLVLKNNTINPQNEKEEENGQRRGILQPHKVAFNFDVLAWHIDPRQDKAGFSPHRDRQPETLAALKDSFYGDGQAKYVTHWVALSDATPENSCLYVIPKEFDPGYAEGDDPPEDEGECSGNKSDDGNCKSGEKASDPLSRALRSKQSYQNIRALPRNAGQSLIFTHRILHWGSRGNPNAIGMQPRIAISFVYADVNFEAPYLVGEAPEEDCEGNRRCPPFSTRLLLVCAQLLIYYQRFDLPASTLRACYDYCKANSDKLHEAYRKKVFVEFVKAMKERMDDDAEKSAADGKSNAADGENSVGCDANSDDEEALLEEMLDHSDAFEDDYDDMCGEGEGAEDEDGGGKRRKVDG